MRLFDESKKNEYKEEAAITKVQLTKLHNIKKACGSPRHGEDSDETTSLHRGNQLWINSVNLAHHPKVLAMYLSH
jgi:hypothetical protein